MRVVGREAECRAALELVVEGRRSLLVRGEAGVGKTTLCDVVGDELRSRGWAVERTAGTVAGAEVPFGAFAHLQGPGAAPSQTSTEHLIRLSALVLARAGDRDLLLFVDDAHLLDAASVLLVRHLVVHEAVPVLLAMRSSEPSPEDLLRLVRDGRAAVLDLSPLSRASCDELVAAQLGGDVGAAVEDEVWRLSQGNPLFVTELLAATETEGRLRRDRDGVLSLLGPLGSSTLLDEVIGARLSQLDDDARSVIEALAVAGPLRLGVVERLAGLDTLEVLESAQLVRSRRRDEEVVVDVAHPLHGELTRQRGSAARLQRARRAVIAALGSDPSAAGDLLLRARLGLDCGDVDGPTLLAASSEALGQLDGAFALRCAEAALVQEASFEASLLRGTALGMTGRHREAMALFGELAEERDDTAERVQVVLRHANHLVFDQGAIETALELLRTEIARVPVTVSAPLRSYLSYVTFFLGRPDEAAAAAEPLVAETTVPAVVGGLGYVSCNLVMGRSDLVLPVLDRAFDELRFIDVEPAWTASITQFVWCRLLCAWQLGRAVECDVPFEPLHGTAVAYLEHGVFDRHAMPAAQAFIRGHVEAAARGWTQIGALLRTSGLPFSTFNSTLFATALAYLGDVGSARGHLAFVDSTPPMARQGFRWWTERARVWTDVADGDVAGGIERSLELTEQFAIEAFSVTTGLHDVVRLGAAARAIEGLRAQAEREGASWWDEVCLAHAEAAIQDDGDALMAVSQRFADGGLDLDACEAAAQAADAYRRADRRVGELAASARVSELLAVCGPLRTPALEQPVRAVLSERELQVAKLAARGLSNAEIADRLGTSTRTVGNQLQRAYEKLGVHDRRALRDLVDGGSATDRVVRGT